MKTMMRLVAMAVVASPMAFGQIAVTEEVPAVRAVSLQIANGAMAAAAAGAQVKDDLFAGTEKFAQGATEVTEINLDPKMMGMVPGRDAGMAKKMKFMVVHTYTYDKPGMYKPEDVETYRKKLEDGSWSCSVHVREKSGTTDICSREMPGKEGTEMVILTAEPKELTFIHMSGNMSLDEMGKMSGGANSGDGMKKR